MRQTIRPQRVALRWRAAWLADDYDYSARWREAHVPDERNGGIGVLLVRLAALCCALPLHWHAPPWWLRQALCIHSYEGAWNSVGYLRGVPAYGGGLQFTVSTWQSAGGVEASVYGIARTSPREQLFRAWVVYRRDGNSWREWGTAGRCGLR